MGAGFEIAYSREFWVIATILQQDKEGLEAILKICG